MKKLVNTHDIEKDYALEAEKAAELSNNFWNGVVSQIQGYIDQYGLDGAGKILSRVHENQTGIEWSLSMDTIRKEYINFREVVMLQVSAKNKKIKQEADSEADAIRRKAIAEEKRIEDYEAALKRKKLRERDEKLIKEMENES